MSVQKLIDDIVQAREMDLAKDIKRYPRTNMRLSDIPDCCRQLVYGVLNWNERALFDIETIARLRKGNSEESEGVQYLLKLGFKVVLTQQAVDVNAKNDELLARGHIDGFLEHEGKRYPFEFKSANVNIYNSIKTIDDLQSRPYTRKYIRQL
ncbi:unnamed protein product, partial [marine sediment metagenome]